MEPTRKVVLKKNKSIDKIWHPDSALVFKSLEEKIVIGRLENGKVITLDEIALSLCEEWKFKYDETLLPENEQDENEQDENEQDENEQDEDEEQQEHNQQEQEEQEQEHNQHNQQEQQEEQQQDETQNQLDEKNIYQYKSSNLSKSDEKIEMLFLELQKSVSEKINLLESNNSQYILQIKELTKELEDCKNQLTLVKTELQDTETKLQHIKNIFK